MTPLPCNIDFAINFHNNIKEVYQVIWRSFYGLFAETEEESHSLDLRDHDPCERLSSTRDSRITKETCYGISSPAFERTGKRARALTL